jgi:acyl homoserine lactone synthase
MLQGAPFQHHRVVRGAILPAWDPVAGAAPARRSARTRSKTPIEPEASLVWDVTSRDGHEYDRFDDADSLYVLGTDEEEALCGGWRLRPTDRGSMLGEVFTPLLQGAPAPCDPAVWEISRFVVRKDARRAPGARKPCWGARALLREAVRFAIEHEISRYVFVVSLAVERLIAHSGVRVHRFASPVRIGRSLSVACWVDIDEHTRRLLLEEERAPGDPA